MSRRDITLYFDDIREAIAKIERFTANMTLDAFLKDEKTIDAVIRNFEVLGEAASHLTDHEREQYPTLPWAYMIAMRNKVIHEYFGVNTALLWKTIQEDIPDVKRALEAIQ